MRAIRLWLASLIVMLITFWLNFVALIADIERIAGDCYSLFLSWIISLLFYLSASATAFSISSPLSPRLRMVPSGPKRIISGMPLMPYAALPACWAFMI